MRMVMLKMDLTRVCFDTYMYLCLLSVQRTGKQAFLNHRQRYYPTSLHHEPPMR